jgi:trk system potassium uptake protein TrkA
MNILIVGLGEVGSYLALVLFQEGHQVTVIDPDSERLRRVTNAIDVQALLGDGSRPDVLDRADVDEVDLLLAVSNDDNVNMLTCLFGRRMGAKTTVLRVKDASRFRRSRTFFRKNLLFDLLLSLEDLAAEEIVKVIRQNQAVGVETFAEGKIQLHQLRLSAGSNLVDVALKDLKIPPNVLITAVTRRHQVIIPGGEDVLEDGDEIFVIGEPKGIAAFERRTGIRPAFLDNVVLYGSSPIAVAVAAALERLNVKTRLIVDDREAAQELAGGLERTTVLHGEGTDLDLLREERVGEADVFMGLSETDEKNLMSCQLARSQRVPRTLALVNKPDYVAIYQKLGVDIAVSPRLLCANRILSFVHRGSVSAIATIEEGKAEVLELELRPSSRLVGRTLAKAGLPRGCVVGAIVREDGSVHIPRGDDVLHALDNLVLFVLKDVVARVIELAGAEAE